MLSALLPDPSMKTAVSLHPYFQVRPGNLAAVKQLLREFVARTSAEPKMLYYEFTINGDTVFCREAYTDGAGALAHLQNVKDLLEKMGGLSDLVRLEIHGPAEELESLRPAVGALNPAWFAYECGVTRSAGRGPES